MNMYDFGARNYDPALGMWMNVDPLAEHPKQVSISPYAYTANNPIRYTDPTGMIWENEKDAQNLEEKIGNEQRKQQKDINRMQRKIDAKDLSDNAIARRENRINRKQGRIDEMEKSIQDIEILGKNEDYTFRLVSGGEINHVIQGDDDVINIQGLNTAIHIHEIRHVSLALTSERGMQFSESKLISTTVHGLFDEMESYKAQYAFDPSSLPFKVKNIRDLNYSNRRSQVLMTRELGELQHKGKPVYERIYKLHKEYLKNGMYNRL